MEAAAILGHTESNARTTDRQGCFGATMWSRLSVDVDGMFKANEDAADYPCTEVEPDRRHNLV